MALPVVLNAEKDPQAGDAVRVRSFGEILRALRTSIASSWHTLAALASMTAFLALASASDVSPA